MPLERVGEAVVEAITQGPAQQVGPRASLAQFPGACICFYPCRRCRVSQVGGRF